MYRKTNHKNLYNYAPKTAIGISLMRNISKENRFKMLRKGTDSRGILIFRGKRRVETLERR